MHGQSNEAVGARETSLSREYMMDIFDGSDDSKDNLRFIYDCKRFTRDPIVFYNEILGNNFEPYYHRQEEIFREFHRDKYGCGEPYNKLILNLGQRSSKSFIGTSEAIYGFFEALTVGDRNAKYGIKDDQLITIAIASNSMTQLEDGIWNDIQNIIEKSEWFNTWFDFKVRASDISCKALNVKIRPMSSNAYSAAGRSVLRAIIDEIDLFESSIGRKSAMELVNILSNATATFGTDGKVICFSSPKLENGTIMTLYKQAIECDIMGKRLQPRTLAYHLPTWEMNTNPALKREVLMERYKFDLDTFYRDFAADPRSAGGLVFPEGLVMSNRPNGLMNYSTVDTKFPHVLAIDPAATKDKFGLAIGYYDWMSDKIVVDGSAYLEKHEGDPYLSPTIVHDKIFEIIDKCNIKALIYDTYMYMEILEACELQKGIEVTKHVVDTPDFDTIKSLQSYGKVEIAYNEFVQYEFKNLIAKQLQTKVRIDHSSTSSKDVADCVANVIWYLNHNGTSSSVPTLNKIIAF